MKQFKHWQDVVNALLGVWLAVSPWLVSYQEIPSPTANAVLVGVALVCAAVGAAIVPRAWEEWIECALGAWLVISPWIIGFGMHRAAMLTAVITGAVIVALALWTLLTDKDYSGWMHRAAH